MEINIFFLSWLLLLLIFGVFLICLKTTVAGFEPTPPEEKWFQVTRLRPLGHTVYIYILNGIHHMDEMCRKHRHKWNIGQTSEHLWQWNNDIESWPGPLTLLVYLFIYLFVHFNLIHLFVYSFHTDINGTSNVLFVSLFVCLFVHSLGLFVWFVPFFFFFFSFFLSFFICLFIYLFIYFFIYFSVSSIIRWVFLLHYYLVVFLASIVEGA